MFELSNSQRRCFGLVPVREHWERIVVKSSPYDDFKTYLYLDGYTVVKCILVGEAFYSESEMSEKLSFDRMYLLPKTAKGKPVLLSSFNVLKRTGIGMCLYYRGKGNILYLCNEQTECFYYSNYYSGEVISDFSAFSRWVESWCTETSEEDIAELAAFSKEKRKHIRYKEGDVFRFKIGRRLYGYGRILLDYDLMRKKNEAFWDILMGKPLVCSVYHIVTDRKDVSVQELANRKSLPSTIIADNSIYYGDYSVIGNIPVSDNEDYPIMYGKSIQCGEDAVYYQQGRFFSKIENEDALDRGFTNNAVSFVLNLELDILNKCIESNSNDPYWTLYNRYKVERDLRNPQNAEKHQVIRNQFGLGG